MMGSPIVGFVEGDSNMATWVVEANMEEVEAEMRGLRKE